MPLFHIEIKCTLENISSLSAIPDNSWVLDVSDPTESEIRTEVVVTPGQDIEIANHKVDFEISFGGKKKAWIICVGSNSTYTDDDSVNQSFKKIMTFETRGCNIVNYHPREDFVAKSGDSNVLFENVDMSEPEWSEYNESDEVPVSITDFEFKITSERN